MSEIRRPSLDPGEVASAAAGEKPSARFLRASRAFLKMKKTEQVLIVIAAALFLGFIILGFQNFEWVGGIQYDTPIQFDEK